ncbi:MAG: hypothetical protein FWB91_00255 [Defluviitaleaceae bacterium]|nr:hypothetical protein [Defluviitaleaceae bacterium]
MNGIIRVFPRRTSYTPEDEYAFIGSPPDKKYLIPEHREVHVCCVFTWDKTLCEELAHKWWLITNKPVKLGAPAYGSPADDFIPGMYIKPNIVFTTRGCNKNCGFCSVPRIEGRLRELPIQPGNVIQDNNFLQASRTHKDKVFAMLRSQAGICFKGGLAVELINSHFIDNVTSLRIDELWLACDSDDALPGFKAAAEKLTKAGFNREKIRCYALIGDDMDKNEARLQEIYHAGAMPFAMLKRDFTKTKTRYEPDWNKFARQWQRPPAIEAHMKRGTSYKDFQYYLEEDIYGKAKL